jgi:hypothetical protein
MRVVVHTPIRGVGEGFSSLGLLVMLGGLTHHGFVFCFLFYFAMESFCVKPRQTPLNKHLAKGEKEGEQVAPPQEALS